MNRDRDVFTTLIDTETLAHSLSDPRVVVVDVRYDLFDHDLGRRQYADAHIPTARFADLGCDLSAAPGGGRGRHPLPSIDALEHVFSQLGIHESSQVVAYDESGVAYAARLWWLLKYLGHDAVAVLDGGIPKWRAEGRPLQMEVPKTAPANFVARPRPSMLVSIDDVEMLRTRTDVRLVDSRADDRFRGENETIDPIGGHIPGAVNRFFRNNLGAEGTFKSREQLRAEMDAMVGSTTDPPVFYCGSGVTACHNLLALEHAGISGGQLYAGSWSEWCTNEGRPIATGDS